MLFFVEIIIASLLANKSMFLIFIIPAVLGLVTGLVLAVSMSDRPIRKEGWTRFISGISSKASGSIRVTILISAGHGFRPSCSG
jgi:sugar phosphate permease